ncbi:MAG: ChbG/HpnK family deacetylase, partial [Chloroflexota bacterium]|nr:ChbG/HpnK family deacetylase [Chloroflexota bacterium]
MLTLIVNADDYGLSPAVSAGIRKAHQDGIVTSTTVMITTPGAADAIRIAQRETPALGLGLHLTLAGMAAAPVTPADQVRSLVRADGLFYDKPEWSARASDFDADEVAREIEAQFAAFMSAAGCPPTHLDSHYHAAYRLPAALETMYTLAHEYELPIRDPGTPGVNLNRFRTPSAFLSVDRGM